MDTYESQNEDDLYEGHGVTIDSHGITITCNNRTIFIAGPVIALESRSNIGQEL